VAPNITQTIYLEYGVSAVPAPLIMRISDG
jgi:hypothetical protein